MACSYVGREDQSICEKPNAAIVNWINSLDESEETASINLNNLSNEQMLNDLYGAAMGKLEHYNNKQNVYIGTVDNKFIGDNSKMVKPKDAITDSTSSADYNNNIHNSSLPIQDNTENSLNGTTNSMSSHTGKSVLPTNNIEYVHVQNQSPLTRGKQNTTLLALQCNTCDTDDTSATQPTNETLVHKFVPESQENFPYVSLNTANVW